MEREKKQRRHKIILKAGVAAGLYARGIETGSHTGLETAASMFGGSGALGYIVIALLAFLLGVCVSVLCFRLRQLHRDDPREQESEGHHGAP